MSKIKKYIGYVLPYFIVVFYRSRQERKRHSLRQQRIDSIKNILGVNQNEVSYSALIDSLIERKIHKEQIIAGSIPEVHLLEIVKLIKEHFDNSPIVGLHVGNYVGVSLSYLAGLLKKMNERNLVVSIDPNIPHRGTIHPQEEVLFLMNKYGLNKNISVITGYSIGKTISNDGIEYTPYDPQKKYSQEYSCENQLDMLKRIACKSFSFAIIDGNHQKEYLYNEIVMINELLCDNGLIIMDDVNEGWKEIKELFESLQLSGLERIYSNERIGVLRKKTL